MADPNFKISREAVLRPNPTSSNFDVPYILMGRENGKDVTEFGHLKRSIVDILTTRIGTRVMLREYGSYLPDLIDEPINQTFRIRAVHATITALQRWEPRIQVRKVSVDASNAREGDISIDLFGNYRLGGEAVELNNVRLDFNKDRPNTDFR